MLVRASIMARGSIWGGGGWSYMAGGGSPGVGGRGGHGGVHACPGEVRPGDLVDLPYWPVDRDTWDVARGD
jgi:hypothetical protein